MPENLKKKTLTYYEAQDFIFQIIQGIKCLHKQGIVHRDIKMDNVLIDNNFTAKITDFTVSIEVSCSDNQLRSLMGAITIQPPEVHQNDTIVEFSSDIWALGLLIYQAVVGVDAIKFENNKNYAEIILNSNIDFEKIEDELIRDLVRKC